MWSNCAISPAMRARMVLRQIDRAGAEPDGLGLVNGGCAKMSGLTIGSVEGETRMFADPDLVEADAIGVDHGVEISRSARVMSRPTGYNGIMNIPSFMSLLQSGAGHFFTSGLTTRERSRSSGEGIKHVLVR